MARLLEYAIFVDICGVLQVTFEIFNMHFAVFNMQPVVDRKCQFCRHVNGYQSEVAQDSL